MKHIVLLLLLSVSFCLQASGQRYALSMNAADYALQKGALNASACVGLSRHCSAEAGCLYNPYSEDFRQRIFEAGAKWWPWNVFSGWWMGAKAKYQEFSLLEEGGGQKEGDRYGGALILGYSRMISTHFNLDFGAGLWAGYETYTAYACPQCGRMISSGNRTFILPDRMLVGLTYIF